MKIDIIHKTEKFSRIVEINLKDKILSTPAYFPSISSYGVKIPLSYLIYLLANFEYPRLLISAYDLSREREKDERLLSSIEKYHSIVRKKKKGFLFIDSGIYESFWYNDPTWDIGSYKETIMGADFDFYSNFDVVVDDKKSDSQLATETFENLVESSTLASKGELVAILHGRSPDYLVRIVDEFLRNYPQLCAIIGIPERDCGNGILEKAQTIMEVRKIIEKHDGNHILHILGCGDPKSMLLYSYYGADTFDSLDWYEHVVNPKTYALEDFSHFALFDCRCKMCTQLEKRAEPNKVEYKDKALLHNLFVYKECMQSIQTLIRNDGIGTYVKQHLGEDIEDKVEQA